MGKRSNFKRNVHDNYPTPFSAVAPLIKHLRLENIREFIEPCAGEGLLIKHLARYGLICRLGTDIRSGIDIFNLSVTLNIGEAVITNPPWTREILHPLIDHVLGETKHPLWLLLDADWGYTKQAYRHMLWCTDIVTVGRVKWIEGSKYTSKDNCAWYRFQHSSQNKPTQFWPREPIAYEPIY